MNLSRSETTPPESPRMRATAQSSGVPQSAPENGRGPNHCPTEVDAWDRLRDAGYADEADRLEAEHHRSEIWRGHSNVRALALGLFGSRRYDELAETMGFQKWHGEEAA